MTDEQESAPKPGPLSIPKAWDLVAAGYNKSTRHFLGKYSEHALKRLAPEKGLHWLDVACGPGTTTLRLAEIAEQVDAVDFAPRMIEQLRANLKNEGFANVTARTGDGQDLPFKERTFDAAISMFGVIFFPDRVQGFRELHRVLKPGGKAVISSWAPVEQSSAMVALMDALRKADPSRPEPKTDIDSLENPEVFKKELLDVGFSNVEIESVEEVIEVGDAEGFWNEMLEGCAPLALLRENLGAEAFEAQSEAARKHLSETLKPGEPLGSVAHIAYATK